MYLVSILPESCYYARRGMCRGEGRNLTSGVVERQGRVGEDTRQAAERGARSGWWLAQRGWTCSSVI